MRYDTWGTPRWLFERLDEEFGPFDLDAAAEPWSATCARYLTEEDGALDERPWPGERVWLNPPYAKEVLTEFLWKSVDHGRGGGLVVCLLPVRTEMAWWTRIVVRHAREIRFIEGRVAFRHPPGRQRHPAGNRPTFSSVIVVFNGGGPPRVTSMKAPRNSRRLVEGPPTAGSSPGGGRR